MTPQSISIYPLSFSISFSQSQSVSVSFSQFHSISISFNQFDSVKPIVCSEYEGILTSLLFSLSKGQKSGFEACLKQALLFFFSLDVLSKQVDVGENRSGPPGKICQIRSVGRNK